MTSCPAHGPAARELFTEMSPSAVQNPYGLYETLRQGPPTYVEDVEAFVVARFPDVQRVISDARQFSSAEVRGPVSLRALGETVGSLAAESQETRTLVQKDLFVLGSLLAADGEDHRRRRAIVTKAFTPRRIRELEPMIRETAHRLIDEFPDDGSVEFVSAFAVPLPVEVIARAIGVRSAIIEDFKRWSDDLFSPMGVNRPSRELMLRFLQSEAEFVDYFDPLIEARRSEPQDDVLQDLLDAEEAGAVLTRPQAMLMCAELVAAGNETTTSMLASTAHLLATDAELLERVRADPTRIPTLVDESIRLEGPIQAFYRTATEEVEVGGTTIPEGSAVLCLFGAANRDPDQFTCPEHVDLDRANGRSHVGFGRGPHACLGSLLAREEGRISFEVLIERLSELDLERLIAEGDHRRSYIVRGLRQLRLTVSATPRVPAA